MLVRMMKGGKLSQRNLQSNNNNKEEEEEEEEEAVEVRA
jgi:hypothetical protein